MLNRELEVTLNLAFKEARAKRHEFMTVEHLLLALLDNEAAATVLRACGANLDKLRRDLQEFIDSTTPLIPQHDDERETQPTLGFQRVLQRAVFHVQSSGKREVTGANVLVAIFSEQESQAVFLLKQQSIARIDVVNYIAHGISKVPGHAEHPQDGEQDMQDEEGGESATSNHPLDAYASNLNELARQGRIDPLVGREHEVERVAQILARRRKNNPLLVGEAGVGKTAIAEGLAKRIVDGQVPDLLADSVVYSLDLGALLAGTKYRGDFEKRFKALLNELRKRPHAVLFIDEIHTIIGAGAASGGVMDASNLLKPVLSSGEIRCIGSTTFQEFRGIFEKDRALARRFQKVDVTEPSVEDTYGILKGLKGRFEQHHHIEYSDEALRAAVRAGGALHQRPAHAGQGHRRHRRGGRLPAPAAGREAREAHRGGAGRGYRGEDRADPAETRHHLGQGVAAQPRTRPQADRVRPGRRHRVAVHRDQAVPGRAQGAGQAGRLVPLRRSHRRGQDRSGAAVGEGLGRGTGALRHVRVHGAAYRVAADRCASGLRRLRPGRPAHRGDHQDPALRVAARRDREGSPGGLQPAAAGDGPRHPDRQQRAQGGLPQHHPDHDHQRRRRSGGARVDRLQPAGSHHRCDGSDQEELHPGVPQPPGYHHPVRTA